MTTVTRSPAEAAVAAARRRWPWRLAAGAAGSLVLLPSATAGAAWYFAVLAVDATRGREYPLRILDLDADAGTVTVTRDPDVQRDIPLGMTWPTGHLKLGGVLSVDKDRVVRRIESLVRGTPKVGDRVFTTAFYHDGDPRTVHGLDFTEVRVPGELGDLPAWRVPPAPGSDAGHGTWVIALHGRGAHRGEVLRILPTLARAGMTTLAMTYRNDEGAPASPDRSYHLGDTEWRDVAAAVAHARAHGATGVVLLGWSMGGGMAMTALRRMAPEDAALVRGVVVDCPVFCWAATLRLQAAQRGIPCPLTWAALRLIERRGRLHLGSLDHVPYAQELTVPVLAFVDTADRTADLGPTYDFAAANPELVTLVETVDGGHTRCWNAGPQAYERALATWLASVTGTRTGAPEG